MYLTLDGKLVAIVFSSRRLRDEGYDAATGYTHPRAGMADETALEAPDDRMVDVHERIWYSSGAEGVIGDVPVAAPGWDSQPGHGGRALVRTTRSPDKFTKMLR